MRFETRLRTGSSLIDLTPLVDVIFLMLVFFILTSDILPLKSLGVENPGLDRDSAALATQLLVVMDAQNVIYFGHQKEIIDLTSFKNRLQSELAVLRTQQGGSDPTVVLSIDRRVDYGNFLQLFSQAQECGPRVRLVYKSEQEV